MIQEKLQNLGLSKNETITYVELCKIGQSTGGNLIKITGFHRNIIYDNLEKLTEKGLVSYIIENNKKLFIASPPDSLQDFIEEEKSKIREKETLANEIIKEMKPMFNKGNNNHEAIIIRGTHALKQEFELIFKEKLDYVSFGAPERSTDIMGAHYWKSFVRKQQEHKIKGKLIFNESLRNWTDIVRTKYHQFKYLNKELEPLTQTMIYGDTTTIIVWVEKPITTIIRSKEVAESYLQYFNILWNSAKE